MKIGSNAPLGAMVRLGSDAKLGAKAWGAEGSAPSGEVLYDGALTFENGWYTGNITLTGEMVEGKTVTITIDGVDYVGTVEENPGGAGYALWVSIEDGDNELTLYGSGEATDFYIADLGSGSFPVKIVQSGGEEGTVLFDGTITIEGGEGEIELLAEMVEGRPVTGTFGEYNVSGIVVDNGGGALGVNLVFDGYTDSDYIEVDADGFVEINDYTLTIEDGGYQFKITMSGK